MRYLAVEFLDGGADFQLVALNDPGGDDPEKSLADLAEYERAQGREPTPRITPRQLGRMLGSRLPDELHERAQAGDDESRFMLELIAGLTDAALVQLSEVSGCPVVIEGEL
jgi:hypothetical protein